MSPASDPNEPEDAVRKRTLIDALYRKYSQALRRFLFRQRLNREEVADLVQETYYRIHQSAAVEEIRNPRAFLFQVANNLRLNTRRWVLARTRVGMMEASITRRFPTPNTRHSASTTAPGSPARPMRQVQLT